MSLKDLEIKKCYRTLHESIVKNFYVPTLKESISYKRGVAYFTSSGLSEIADGISGLVRNNGKIQLIVSPDLSQEDIKAIRQGYENRESIIKKALIKEFKDPENDYQKNRLNYLANLIEKKFLDVKVVITNNGGIYHEKVGIISDSEGNKITFSGSMNDSKNAYNNNYERVDVFTNWENEEDRVKENEEHFDLAWNNQEPGLTTYEFKDVTDEFIKKYKRSDINTKTFIDPMEEKFLMEREHTFFKIPNDPNRQLRDYQNEAISKWLDNNGRGIFNMATGTGKTFTALCSLAKLSEKLNENLAVIIVAPYKHLVEQWVEDIKEFNVNPIIAYSVHDWRDFLFNKIEGYNLGVLNNFCVITTNATFISDEFQKQICRIKKDFCLIVDEAHNIGAENSRNFLLQKAKYRLALSATIERYGDEEGTQAIRDYFGDICIDFSLEDAIRIGALVHYKYYPILVHLSSDELEKYIELTRRIALEYSRTPKDEHSVNMLLIKRAKIIAGCREKVDRIIEELSKFKNEKNIIVYCGATKYNYEDIDDYSDIRQIEEITRRISVELDMHVRKFTSEETTVQRQEIKQMFIDGDLQVITAIRCLDEGVNIPAIKKAFILASSTNPKEYIQRRGRVLRTHQNKKFAEIYDFITLPRKLNLVQFITPNQKQQDLDMIANEFKRMIEFANSADNPFEINNIMEQIRAIYNAN